MKNVDVSLQWSGGFVFGVRSKNNDFKIFQGLNSDSCCDLSVEMARGISSIKHNIIMQICAIRCYKRYCLSQ